MAGAPMATPATPFGKGSTVTILGRKVSWDSILIAGAGLLGVFFLFKAGQPGTSLGSSVATDPGGLPSGIIPGNIPGPTPWAPPGGGIPGNIPGGGSPAPWWSPPGGGGPAPGASPPPSAGVTPAGMASLPYSTISGGFGGGGGLAPSLSSGIGGIGAIAFRAASAVRANLPQSVSRPTSRPGGVGAGAFAAFMGLSAPKAPPATINGGSVALRPAAGGRATGL